MGISHGWETFVHLRVMRVSPFVGESHLSYSALPDVKNVMIG